jgi:hypothetical protein
MSGGESCLGEGVVECGFVGAAGGTDLWWVGCEGGCEVGEAVSEEPVVGSAEEEGMTVSGVGDSVTVAVRDTFDEPVVA